MQLRSWSYRSDSHIISSEGTIITVIADEIEAGEELEIEELLSEEDE